jgi:hypothetical protein
VHILLDRGRDDLVHRAVVTKMNHFDAERLENPAHDVDRRIVSIKQGRRCDESQPTWHPGVRRLLYGGFRIGFRIGLRFDECLKSHLYFSCSF